MERIFSARLDEGALDELERVTQKFKMTKRKFLEDAIHGRARQLEGVEAGDVWSETLGAWKRQEQPVATMRRARTAFRRAFGRQQRAKLARVRR